MKARVGGEGLFAERERAVVRIWDEFYSWSSEGGLERGGEGGERGEERGRGGEVCV